jgi:hypothetical protein
VEAITDNGRDSATGCRNCNGWQQNREEIVRRLLGCGDHLREDAARGNCCGNGHTVHREFFETSNRRLAKRVFKELSRLCQGGPMRVTGTDAG